MLNNINIPPVVKNLLIINVIFFLAKMLLGTQIDLDNLSLEDAKTFQLFKEGKTVGIFQYESLGMQKYMRELKPDIIFTGKRPGEFAK